uniref:Uncharacterized protein n=1 Tax=Pyramimonas obovata TaxID=1411642 RepID=A0A7S0RXQ2_9CHLO|mmetsp:Transcript_8758/g.18155  ORF Transcript_8758/g.18155 Transcript_8758/m.18155 type:complete len:414 (+) Transcript_8758:293-1534(+)
MPPKEGSLSADMPTLAVIGAVAAALLKVRSRRQESKRKAGLEMVLDDLDDTMETLNSTRDQLTDAQQQVQVLEAMLKAVTVERDRAVSLASLQEAAARKAITDSMKHSQAASAAKFDAMKAELDLSREKEHVLQQRHEVQLARVQLAEATVKPPGREFREVSISTEDGNCEGPEESATRAPSTTSHEAATGSDDVRFSFAQPSAQPPAAQTAQLAQDLDRFANALSPPPPAPARPSLSSPRMRPAVAGEPRTSEPRESEQLETISEQQVYEDAARLPRDSEDRLLLQADRVRKDSRISSVSASSDLGRRGSFPPRQASPHPTQAELLQMAMVANMHTRTAYAKAGAEQELPPRAEMFGMATRGPYTFPAAQGGGRGTSNNAAAVTPAHLASADIQIKEGRPDPSAVWQGFYGW